MWRAARAFVLYVNGGNIAESGVISDNDTGLTALTLNASVGLNGTLTLSGANTYTGATTVTRGTLVASTTTGKALGGTASIAVTGGTLLLGTANQVNAAAPITLGVAATSNGLLSVVTGANQGTAAVKAGGVTPTTGAAAGLGTLTLNNTATLTYSGAGTTLVFGLFTPGSNVLNITGYTNTTITADGANGGGVGDDRLVFSGTLAPVTAFNFNGAGAGVGVSEIALDNGFYEVAFAMAVPEPGTWVGLLLGAGVLGFVQRRRAASV